MPQPVPQPVNPQSAADLTGRTVGRFVIRARLGAGGMGEVYRADDTQLKRPVALKRVAPRLQSDPAYRQRFLREAQFASGLNNPHIAGVYDVLETNNEVFVVMEYVEGETLRQKLAQPVPLNRLLDFAVQCAEALVAAHQRNIIHRDLKPENIMLTPGGQVKILDFGVAKQLPHADDTTTLDPRAVLSSMHDPAGGTLAYMAPEVMLGQESDQRSDIFSLGVVFYEMFGGQHPFRTDSSLATATRVLQEIPPPLRHRNPKLPLEIERIVGKMLAKDPSERYATAADLLVDLRAVQRANQPGVLPAPVPSAETPLPAKYRRWLWIAAALAAGLAVMVAINPGGVRDRVLGRVKPVPIESIAVLPLDNLSRDPEQDYFTDGMTEALITELASVSGLRVVSRTSVMRYKDSPKPLAEIARELKVDAILEGSVLRSAGRVRINAELVHAATDRHLWASSYEGDLADVLALQNEVARSVTREIKVKLTQQEQARLAGRGRAVNPDAYEAYLRGRFYWNKRTEEGFQNAIRYFQQAIAQDASYAPAYAGLADSYVLLGNYRAMSPREAYPLAKAAASKALELDDSLAEAHASLAGVRMFYLELPGVETEFKRALELNPNYSTALQWHALFLAAMSRPDEALTEIKRARELDPLSLIINANVAWCYYLARRYDDSAAQAQKTLELDSRFAVAQEYLAQAYLEQGKYEAAFSAFADAIALSAGNTGYRAELGNAFAVAGRKADARKILGELTEQAQHRYVSPYDFALLYAGLDSKEEAIRWLEKAYDEREAPLLNLNAHPRFERLRSDRRFRTLLHRIGFPAN